MFDILTTALRALVALTLIPAAGLVIGLTGREIHDQHASYAVDREAALTTYPRAVPDACDEHALADVRRTLPPLDITWQWADLDKRRAVGLAYWRSRVVLLDPELDCRDVPTVASHEWTHIATAVYYGGDRFGDTTVRGVPNPESGRPHEVPVLELVADCGAALLTAVRGDRFLHHPMLDRAGGCAPDILERTLAVLEAGGIDVRTLPELPAVLGPVGSGVS